MTAVQWSHDLRSSLFDEIPSGVAVLAPDLQVVDHNRAFDRVFGTCRGEPCYRATKGRETPCHNCPVLETFRDGRSRCIEQEGTDRRGREVHYLVQVTPMSTTGTRPEWVATITTDLTSTRRLQREYHTLFEKVPCFVAVINRDLRVVKANEAFRDTFGRPTGEPCYRLYMQRDEPCPDCPAARTFADGLSHRDRRMGVSARGTPTPYLVVTAPLVEDEGVVTHVIEMALDLTEHDRLEAQLREADALRAAVVEKTADGILVLDAAQRVVLANPAAAQLLGRTRDELDGRPLELALPEEITEVLEQARDEARHEEFVVTGRDGAETPVALAAVRLSEGSGFAGAALVLHDLSELKRLEGEKLEVERLAAVGQTVAGLAHGIKNIITGLEGGMYVASTGMQRGDADRVGRGWDMLVRNMGRISELTRNLLAFSRGESFECGWVRPDEVAAEVVELYRDKAAELGIELEAEVAGPVERAWMDGDGLHSCVANLVSNAVDACTVSDPPGGRVVVRVSDHDEVLSIEVSDTGCGMDAEVSRRAFTSFFTTKGKGGTGLGLLLTRKIVQQHGGTVDFTSNPGKGTRFCLRFPRRRLPRPGGHS